MSRVSSPPPAPSVMPQSNVSPTPPAAAVAPPAARASASSTAPPMAPANPAADSRRSVPINGLSGLDNFDAWGIGRGQSSAGSFTPVNGDAPADRGYISCDAQAIPGGVRLTVHSYHQTTNENLSLILQGEVLDLDTNELMGINLTVLANKANLNGDGYRGKAVFDISYDEINKYLQARNPKLKVNPGTTQLAVAAVWHNANGGVQHRAGGMARGGAFRLPAPVGATNVTNVQIGNMTGASRRQPDLPLDMAVTYPKQLVDSFSMLAPDGSVVSRLESEFKGSASPEDMGKAIHKMYELVAKAQSGDKAAVEAAFGKGWSIKTVNRYWIKDDGSANLPGKPGAGFFAGFRVDDDGLPIQDPMLDDYMDDANLSMTALQGAIRLRHNEQATQINVKPGGGRTDPKTGITQRIEVGVDLKPGATVADAASFLRQVSASDAWRVTVFNQAAREVEKLDSKLSLAETLNPWLKVVQDRHKFTLLQDKTGVEVEFSFDKVMVETLRPEHANRDGTPRRATFYVLEGELDHLQLGSNNDNSFLAAGANTSMFNTDKEQDAWLSRTSENITMDVEPRLHELEDLENESFRQTDDYKTFEKINARLKSLIFPKGLKAAKQKAAQAAEVLGLSPLRDNVVVDVAHNSVVGSGLQWQPELDDLFKKVVAHVGAEELSSRLAEVESKGIVDVLERLGGIFLPPLTYDVQALEKIVAAKLEPAGFKLNQEVRDFLAKLDPKVVSPQEFERELSNRTRVDAYNAPEADRIFRSIAAKVGVKTPTPDAYLSGMLAELPKRLEEAWVAKESIPALEKYFEEAFQNGASIPEIHQAVSRLQNNTANALEALEKHTGDGSAPVVNIDIKKFREEAYRRVMQSDFVKPSAALDDFLAEVAKAKPVREARQWLNSVREAKTALDNVASELGLVVPKFDYDLDTFTDVVRQRVRDSEFVYHDDIGAFARKLVEQGTMPSSVVTLMSTLKERTIEEGLQRQNITLPAGLAVPAVQVDVGRVLSRIRSRFGSRYTADMETYLRNNVPVALTKSEFNPRVLFGWDFEVIVGAVEKATGTQRPSANAS